MRDEQDRPALSLALLSVEEQLQQPAGAYFSSLRWDVDPDDPLEQNASDYFSKLWDDETSPTADGLLNQR